MTCSRLSLSNCSPSSYSGGGFESASPGLERAVSKRLDQQRHRVGIQDSVPGQATFDVVSSSGSSFCGQGEGRHSFKGGSRLVGEGSSDSASFSNTGVLRQAFLRPQAFRWVPPGPRFVSPQHLHQAYSFQDGDSGFDSGCHPPGRLGYVDRSFGRILSCYHAPFMPSLAPFSVERGGVPVRCTPVRSLAGSSNLYEDYERIRPDDSRSWYPSQGLSGRLVNPCSISGDKQPPHFSSVGPGSQARFSCQRDEIRAGTFPEIHLSGNVVRHSQHDNSPSPSTSRTLPGVSVDFVESELCDSTRAGIAPGDDGVHVNPIALGQVAQATASKGVQASFPPSDDLVFSGGVRSLVLGGNHSVDRRDFPHGSSPHGSSSVCVRGVHRRLSRRLGGVISTTTKPRESGRASRVLFTSTCSSWKR